MKRSFLLVALAGATCAASAGDTRYFLLSDHEDGNAAPPTYGLRMDGLFGGGVTTFTFNTDDGVYLTVTDDTANSGSITLEISGTMFGGETSGGGYIDGAFYDVSFVYTANVVETASGWKVTGVDNVENTGSIVRQGSGDSADVVTMTDNDNNAFLFQADGHRISNDNMSWVGRGWLTTNDNGSNINRTQDWLFTGTEVDNIPAPGAIAIAGLGGFVAARRRRS